MHLGNVAQLIREVIEIHAIIWILNPAILARSFFLEFSNHGFLGVVVLMPFCHIISLVGFIVTPSVYFMTLSTNTIQSITTGFVLCER